MGLAWLLVLVACKFVDTRPLPAERRQVLPQSAANKSLLASSTGPRRSSYTQCGAKKEAPWWEEGASHIGLSCCACTVQGMLADDPVRAMHRAGGGACWCWCWWVLCWCWCVSQLCARVCVCACVCGGLCGGQPQFLLETLDSLPPTPPPLPPCRLPSWLPKGSMGWKSE